MPNELWASNDAQQSRQFYQTAVAIYNTKFFHVKQHSEFQDLNMRKKWFLFKTDNTSTIIKASCKTLLQFSCEKKIDSRHNLITGRSTTYYLLRQDWFAFPPGVFSLTVFCVLYCFHSFCFLHFSSFLQTVSFIGRQYHDR